MLAVSGPLREPDLSKRGVTAQVVDVPVGQPGSPTMVPDPGGEAAGPVRAAYVAVEAGFDRERPERSNTDPSPGRSLEKDDVGAR